MKDSEILELARAAGFSPALIAPADIPVNDKFRVFCEENRCGKYNANYSCPPACGTVEELHRRILAEEEALIVEMIFPIQGYEDREAIAQAKLTHNAAVRSLLKTLRQAGLEGFCSGYNGCPLCNPCKQAEGLPCAFPEERISCMSAYCIDVGELARRCDLPFAWSTDKLHLFGMIAFHRPKC